MDEDLEGATWSPRPSPPGTPGGGRAVDFRVATLGVRALGLERARSRRRLVDLVGRLGGRRRRLRESRP